QLGDLLSALSSLDEIPDLLESFRSKLYQPSTSRELRGKPLRLQHLFILSAHCCRCLVSLRGRQTCHVRGISIEWRRTGCRKSTIFPARALSPQARPKSSLTPYYLAFIFFSPICSCQAKMGQTSYLMGQTSYLTSEQTSCFSSVRLALDSVGPKHN